MSSWDPWISNDSVFWKKNLCDNRERLERRHASYQARYMLCTMARRDHRLADSGDIFKEDPPEKWNHRATDDHLWSMYYAALGQQDDTRRAIATLKSSVRLDQGKGPKSRKPRRRMLG